MEGRTGQALNLAGEKLPEAGVVAAVRAAAAALLPRGAASLRDWAAREALHPAGAAGDSAGHYTFYWELSEGEAAPEPAELARWAAALDGALLQAAPAYGTVRGGMVQPLHLKLVAGGAFDGIRQLAYAAGATAAQYKPPVRWSGSPPPPLPAWVGVVRRCLSPGTAEHCASLAAARPGRSCCVARSPPSLHSLPRTSISSPLPPRSSCARLCWARRSSRR